MDPDHAQLASVATVLDDLTARISEVADRHRGGPHEDLTIDLDEVERSLRSASRRLAHTLRRLA
jgi:hypothetical protein